MTKQTALPEGIPQFIAAFMRSLNTARLYAIGHDLFKKNIEDLFATFREALAERSFLFLGCAKDALFLEGDFFEGKDAHLKKFLQFFHSMGISHLLLQKEVTTDEMEAFIAILAGAGKGQGQEVSDALPQENIRRISIGLLDYTVFSTVQSVAADLAGSSEDQAIWRQLIVQPAASASFNLTPEKMEELRGLAHDPVKMKKLLLQLDGNMKEKKEGVSIMHRGIVLGNLIQNLGDTLSLMDKKELEAFPGRVEGILDTLEPGLKAQILGSVTPNPLLEQDAGVIQDIFKGMEDQQVIYLLHDALRRTGPHSPCFNNLFDRTMARYRDTDLILKLIREEMNRTVLERKSEALKHWQYLEQRLAQEKEAEQLNQQYRREIEALATSIQMETPMVEDEEMDRLLRTLEPQSLTVPKGYLIVELMGNLPDEESETFAPSLLEGLGKTLSFLFQQKQYQTVGNLLRDAFLALTDFSQDALIRQTLKGLLKREEIAKLLRSLLEKCLSYEVKETTAADAVCQLFPEKAGDCLIELMLESKEDDSPRSRWITTTLAGLGPRLTRTLILWFQKASDDDLPRLIDIAVFIGDSQVSLPVEQLLDHKNHEVQIKAIKAIGLLNPERAVPHLKEILNRKALIKSKKLKALQETAEAALARIDSETSRKIREGVGT